MQNSAIKPQAKINGQFITHRLSVCHGIAVVATIAGGFTLSRCVLAMFRKTDRAKALILQELWGFSRPPLTPSNSLILLVFSISISKVLQLFYGFVFCSGFVFAVLPVHFSFGSACMT